MLSGKTFLVTGATGRLGHDLTARLEELGASVLPLVLGGYPRRPKSVPWTAATEPIEVGGAQDLHDLPDPDYAIHLHWKVDRTRPRGEQIVCELDWNVSRLEFLWEWILRRPVERFVNCSSIRIFSHLNANPITADTEPRPTLPYGIAKLAGEKYFSALFAGAYPSVCHLRLASVYSVGEHVTHLMSQLASSALDGHSIKINSGHTAHLLHIDEVIDVIIGAAIRSTPGRYLIVPPGTSTDHVAMRFEDISGRKLVADYVDLAPGVRDPEFVSNIDEFRFEWTRVTPLEEGIRKFIADWIKGA